MSTTYHSRRYNGADPPWMDTAGRARLVKLRAYAGLSTEAVARRFGVDPDRWADIEDGWERPPSGTLLTRWCRWLEDQASPEWGDA